MSLLQIVYAPNPIFKQKAAPIEAVDDAVRENVSAMFETLRIEHAVGLGANMVGLLDRIIVVDLEQEGTHHRYGMINPVITEKSNETHTFQEASLSFPWISADITRPAVVTVEYLDEEGNKQSLKADGFLSSVIQHEMDYLDGKVYLDYLSNMKRSMLLKKMQKHLKKHPPHIHGPGCSH